MEGGGGLPDLSRDSAVAGRAFRTLFEFAPTPIAAVTLDGHVFAANPPLQVVLGISPRPGLLVEDVVGPETRLLWKEDFADLAVGEREVVTREVTLVRPDGGRSETRSTIMAVAAGTGQAPAFILAVIEPLDEQLADKRKLQSSRAYIHDVANTLMALANSAERLLRHVMPSDPARENAETIRDTAARAVALARATLGETATRVEEPQPVDVNGVILGLRGIAADLLGRGIEIVLLPDLQGPYVYADVVGLERALTNIAANAHDAMPDGGTFTIETKRQGDHVLITLSDTGTGIKAEDLETIFEPEFTTKPTGTGLGLASVRDFVTTYGGSVSVESTPDEGSTFTLVLPAAP